MTSHAKIQAHDLPPDPDLPPGDMPPPPPPAPDVGPPPVQEPPFEHPTPIREPSRSPSPMASRRRVAETLQPRALVLCAIGSDEALRLAGAACDVFDGAGIEVDLLPIQGDDWPDLPRRLALAQAVMVAAAPAQADAVAAALDGAVPASAGCAYAMALAGPVDATEAARRRLTDAFDDLGLIDAAAQARLDRFMGCERADRPIRGGWYADAPMQALAANAARELVDAATEIRAGRMTRPDLLLARPRKGISLSR